MTDSLDQAREHRAGVRVAMGHVERCLASPAGDRVVPWAKYLREAVEQLSLALEYHIEATEAPGGLLEEITATAPRLGHRVSRARREHAELRALVRAAFDALPGDDAVDVGSARDRTVELLEAIVRHRHLGADLIYEALNVDIEGAD